MGDQPTGWTLYFASEDVEATALAVTAAGGMVLAAPFDVGPLGRMAVALDPTGAVFGLWQAREHIGISRYNEQGALSWEEGWSPDVAKAKEFYTAVFGFHYSPIPGAGEYWSFALPRCRRPRRDRRPDRQQRSPVVVVLPRFSDARASVAAAVAAGGSVLGGVDDTPFGHMAELTDPQGGRFKIGRATRPLMAGSSEMGLAGGRACPAVDR